MIDEVVGCVDHQLGICGNRTKARLIDKLFDTFTDIFLQLMLVPGGFGRNAYFVWRLRNEYEAHGIRVHNLDG